MANIFTPGMVAVTEAGKRIAIWPNESDDLLCFTGQLLEECSLAKARVHNTSIFWDRSKVVRIEPATDSDKALSLISLQFDETEPRP
jgi:hypothetical protein